MIETPARYLERSGACRAEPAASGFHDTRIRSAPPRRIGHRRHPERGRHHQKRRRDRRSSSNGALYLKPGGIAGGVDGPQPTVAVPCILSIGFGCCTGNPETGLGPRATVCAKRAPGSPALRGIPLAASHVGPGARSLQALELITAALGSLFARHAVRQERAEVVPVDRRHLNKVLELMNQCFQDNLELADLAEVAGLTSFNSSGSFGVSRVSRPMLTLYNCG